VRRSKRGVTLLEMLVAAIIMTIALVAGIELVARAVSVSHGVEERTRAMIFCRGKMEEILKQPVLQAGDEQGEGADSRYDYDWQALIEQSQGEANLMVVTVQATNRTSGRTVQLSVLRRPDLDTPPEGSTAAGADAPPPAVAPAGAAGGPGGGAL